MALSPNAVDLTLRNGDKRGSKAVLRVVDSAVEERVFVAAVRRKEEQPLRLQYLPDITIRERYGK